MTTSKTMLAQCLHDRGAKSRCLSCPLLQGERCSRVMRTMERLQARLNSKDHRLASADHEDILRETLYGILSKVEKSLKEDQQIEDISRMTGAIFNNKRADFYSKLARFGETTTVTLEQVPDELIRMVKHYAAILTLQGKQLSTGPGLQKNIYKKLQAISSDKKWKKTIELLYKNSWKGQLVSLDDFSNTLCSNSQQQEVDEDTGIAALLSPYLFLWENMGSRQARACRELFFNFGEIIFNESDSSRAEIAASLNIRTNSLNKKITRCYGIIHTFLIKKLTETEGEQAGYCRELFFELYVEKGKQKTGLQQRITDVAQKHCVRKQDIYTAIRRCRKLVMRQIDMGGTV